MDFQLPPEQNTLVDSVTKLAERDPTTPEDAERRSADTVRTWNDAFEFTG